MRKIRRYIIRNWFWIVLGLVLTSLNAMPSIPLTDVASGICFPIGHSYLQYPVLNSGQLYKSAIKTTLSTGTNFVIPNS